MPADLTAVHHTNVFKVTLVGVEVGLSVSKVRVDQLQAPATNTSGFGARDITKEAVMKQIVVRMGFEAHYSAHRNKRELLNGRFTTRVGRCLRRQLRRFAIAGGGHY